MLDSFVICWGLRFDLGFGGREIWYWFYNLDIVNEFVNWFLLFVELKEEVGCV